MANMPIDEIENGIKELLETKDGVRRLAELIHELLTQQEVNTSTITTVMSAMHDHQNN